VFDLTLSAYTDVPRLSQGEGRYAMLTKKQISIIFRFNPISSLLAVPLFFQYQCFFNLKTLNVMKKFYTVLVLLMVSVSFVNAQPAFEQRSLEEALNPDGTLKRGVQGSFKVEGYTMRTGKNGEPIFEPQTQHTASGTWSSLGTGSSNGVLGGVLALAVVGNEVFVGGEFTLAGGIASTFIARWIGGATNVEPISIDMPSTYLLQQNYPNPFNPSTTILFSIPTSEFVTLKVYDLLGREIATLVNENLSAGSYSYKFDASNLTSGVYFYKLQAGKYSETKKMLLSK
jgi:hypothetical protein